MQDHISHRTMAASRREPDAKHELLQQLGYADRYFDEDHDIASLSEKLALLDQETDRWVQSEYEWALEEAADSAVSIPDLFDVEEEDEESCLPSVYDPTFFSNRPPCALSLPLVPPSTPATSHFSSPVSSQPASPRSVQTEKLTPPPSPRLSSRLSSSPKPRPFPRPHAASVSGALPARPLAQRHATYPSISSTMSVLEERETHAEKRAAVYVSGEDPTLQQQPTAAPRLAGRGRSSSATVTRTSDENCGPFSIGSSPRRKQRPTLPALATSHSTPQLRTLAELASIPSPSLAPPSHSVLLPSPMSDTTLTPDSEEVSPGEAITWSPSDDGDWASHSPAADPAAAEGAESGTALASRWSLDSVASRPRIRQAVVPVPDVSSSPASKTKKRDRLLSLISGRARAGSVGKPNPPPNTPRGSSDVLVLDIRRSESREAYNAMQTSSFSSATRPSFNLPTVPPKIQLTPSVSSSSGSSASTLATPIEPMQPSPLPDMDPFAAGAPSCMYEEAPVFAENPHLAPESPLLAPMDPKTPPSPPRQSLTLQIPERPETPGSPPPQPTLPLPSPSTPSPSFLVPTPRSQSFFASLKSRQKRRKKKLVISGAPLELHASRASSSLQAQAPAEGAEQLLQQQQRALERSRRVQNVVKWCESFGPVRKIDTKEDGSLHVYWKDWEVADMVCRIQAQVVIKDVGRVNLAWSYIS
ncbi:hypothetical protein FKP32DRAFT_1298462 [Trametes sanguinea]|nr:hypothetical protein FKP32DRAFT_1298462 [Trametes sanguinea]